jgi:hypothetical protein
MLIKKTLAPVFVLSLLSPSVWASRPVHAVTGDYVEIRSCDVYTGPCFANGEMGLAGKEAILTWSVREGTWDGVPLDGLNVLAVLKARDTLGDVARKPVAAQALLVIDSRADESQRRALVEFAHDMAGSLLDNVVRIETSEIGVTVRPPTCPANGCSTVRAGGLVEIQTRCLGGKDHVCGNEQCYYPPLTEVENARPAYTMVGLFQGPSLGLTFDDTDRRSAYLATFSR